MLYEHGRILQSRRYVQPDGKFGTSAERAFAEGADFVKQVTTCAERPVLKLACRRRSAKRSDLFPAAVPIFV